MKILSNIKDLVPDQSGKVILVTESIDDIWEVYNIISKGDLIQIKVTRKIIHESKSGIKSASKKQFQVILRIESIEYDVSGKEIRLNGKNVYENDHISIGQYQSAVIGINTKFGIIKRLWDSFLLDRLIEASDPQKSCDLAVLLMEEGLSNLYLVSSKLTLLKGKIEMTIPKKRKNAQLYEKHMEKFFEKTLDLIRNHVCFDIVKCLVIGSPGFIKDQFGLYVSDISKIIDGNNSSSSGNTSGQVSLVKFMNCFVFCHTSSGYKQSLNEILTNKEVLIKIKNTKAMEEITIVNKYNEILGKDYERIIFGLKHIEYAIEQRAVDLLLVTDDYLRKIGGLNRKKLQEKIDKVVVDGGISKVLSCMLPPGERINSLGGLTAILKYKLNELDDMENENEDEYEKMNKDNDELDEDALIDQIERLGFDEKEIDENEENEGKHEDE